MLFILIFNNTVYGTLTVMEETSISHEKRFLFYRFLGTLDVLTMIITDYFFN